MTRNEMKKKKRCVIVGGADINNYGFICKKLCADNYMVFCNSGLKHLEKPLDLYNNGTAVIRCINN